MHSKSPGKKDFLKEARATSVALAPKTILDVLRQLLMLFFCALLGEVWGVSGYRGHRMRLSQKAAPIALQWPIWEEFLIKTLKGP